MLHVPLFRKKLLVWIRLAALGRFGSHFFWMASASGPPGSDGPYANPLHRRAESILHIPLYQSSGHVKLVRHNWNMLKLITLPLPISDLQHSQAFHANRRSQDWICHGRDVLVAAFSEGLASNVFSSLKSGCCLSFLYPKWHEALSWIKSNMIHTSRPKKPSKWIWNKANHGESVQPRLNTFVERVELAAFLCVSCVSCVSQNEPEHLVSH